MEDIAKEVAKHIQRGMGPITRNKESVRAEILAIIANNRKISGTHGFETGFVQMVTEFIQDKKFQEAIDQVVNKIMIMFPESVEKDLHHNNDMEEILN